MNDRFGYLRRFVAAPAQIGSVAPSSPFLTRAMLRGIGWSRMRTIVELGAGTGVFTAAIEAARLPESRFLVFEKEAGLRGALQRRFAAAELHADAAVLRQLVGDGGADCVISGLPFANFGSQLRRTLLHDIRMALRPGGLFVAFQYSLQMRAELRGRFDEMDLELVLRNVPPAVVYRCRNRVAPECDLLPAALAGESLAAGRADERRHLAMRPPRQGD
jgi:phospholipid N-methyltransferase